MHFGSPAIGNGSQVYAMGSRAERAIHPCQSGEFDHCFEITLNLVNIRSYNGSVAALKVPKTRIVSRYIF
jgi:hypothetical protein